MKIRREMKMKIWKDEKCVDENIRISCHNFRMEIILQLIMEAQNECENEK